MISNAKLVNAFTSRAGLVDMYRQQPMTRELTTRLMWIV